MLDHRGLQECWRSAECWITSISNSADRLAGVLGQCAALAHLDVDGNWGIRGMHDTQECRRHFNNIKIMMMKRQQVKIRKEKEEKEGRKKEDASR
jgi:hypothetical protein